MNSTIHQPLRYGEGGAVLTKTTMEGGAVLTKTTMENCLEKAHQMPYAIKGWNFLPFFIHFCIVYNYYYFVGVIFKRASRVGRIHRKKEVANLQVTIMRPVSHSMTQESLLIVLILLTWFVHEELSPCS
jgi:hypothetical protein